MTALTVATEPVLRLLPVPVTEPDPVPAPPPALRLVPGVAPEPRGRDGDAADTADHGGTLGPRPLRPRPTRLTEPPTEPLTERPQADRPVPPPAAAWARQFVQAALEAAAGRRPVTQLVRWTSDEVYALLNRRAALAARLASTGSAVTGPCLVRSMRLCRPSPAVVEASVLVVDHGRYRAVALRLEDADGRWRATALEIG